MIPSGYVLKIIKEECGTGTGDKIYIDENESLWESKAGSYLPTNIPTGVNYGVKIDNVIYRIFR